MRIENQAGEPRFTGSFTAAPANMAGSNPFADSEAPDERQVWLRLPIHRPLFTLGILAILGVIMLLEQVPSLHVEERFWKYNPAIIDGEYYRLITAAFLHVNWLHIAFNGFGIFLLGQQVENFFGRWRFLSIYMLAGLAGSVGSFAFNTDYPSEGASGALFGLIGALGAYFWVHRRLLGAQGRAQLLNVLFMAGINLAIGLSQGLVDNWGHLGGLLAGTAAGLALVPHYKLGRSTGVDERLLEDRTPIWVPILASVALFVVIVGLFLIALMAQTSNG